MFTEKSNIVLICLVAALLPAVVAAKHAPIVKIEPSSRIVNGTIISIEEAPFMVQLRDSHFGTICGGTLVSLQHVLTAAHCVEDDLYKYMTVVGGASWRNETGVEREIAKVFIHPSRKLSHIHADVAILKLNKPFEESRKIQAQKNLCSVPPEVGEYIKVTGWGAKWSVSESPSPTDYSEELRRVRVPIISDDECRQRMIFVGTQLTETNICAYKEYQDACETDSGGPGIYGDKLCAVVSAGVGCAYGGFPGIYTSIVSVRDFIEEKLKV